MACGAFSSGDAPDAQPADASAIDSGTTDETGVVDAGNADAANVKFCASLTPKPTFCVDFDEGEPASTGFDEMSGTVSLDTRFAFSPPSSLLASNLDGGGGAKAASWLARTIPSGATAQRVSFMIRLGDDDGGALPGSPFAIVLRLVAGDCQLDLDVAALGTGYLDVVHHFPDDGGATDERATLLRRPAPGQWTKIELRLTAPPPGNLRAELDIGGAAAIDPITTSCPGLSASPRLFIGPLYSNDAVVRYDDVVFDGK
jgi:hypothetical protein